MSPNLDKIKKFWLEHEFRVILAVGFVLIAAVAFESGYLKGKSALATPIIVEKAALEQSLNPDGAQGRPLEGQNSAQEAKTKAVSPNTPPQDCQFVGSKNSNKYHVPTCRFAKLIKPENTVCFASAEAATAKGYLPDKGCIK